MKFSVIGIGYVGLSISLLLSQRYNVECIDIDKKKLKLISEGKSPINDKDIKNFLKNKKLSIKFASKIKSKDSDFYIICTPTNYNEKTGSFNTRLVSLIVKKICLINSNANIVIKSTIPFGFTDKLRKKYKNNNIFFSPEFLRESKSLHDNLFPSRIIVGDYTKNSKIFAKCIASCSALPKKEINIIQMTSSEAESVKLFANTYLAMRISYFNELDTFCELNNLDTKSIIRGVCLDSRVGMYYNNPSFGYGGYCLPKDTKQLLKNFENIPNDIISSVIKSNKTRKNFIATQIIKQKPKSLGIYRLIMKNGSDNFRESAILDIINILKKKNIKINLYEPFMKKDEIKGVKLIDDLTQFISSSDIIIANRFSKNLNKAKNKVYSRDLFREN